MKFKLKDAHIVSLTKYPGEAQTTQVLILAALLTPPIADKLRCREACYNEEGVPRQVRRLSLARRAHKSGQIQQAQATEADRDHFLLKTARGVWVCSRCGCWTAHLRQAKQGVCRVPRGN